MRGLALGFPLCFSYPLPVDDFRTRPLDVDDDVEFELLIPVVDLFCGARFPNVVVGPDASEQRRVDQPQ